MSEEIHSRRGPDGFLELWIAGWHIVFDGDGEPATPTRGEPPADAESDAQGVEIGRTTAGIVGVRLGAWIVLLANDPPAVMPAEPVADPNSYLYRLYWRHGD